MAVDFILAGSTTYNVTGTVSKIEAIGCGGNGYWGFSNGASGGGGGAGAYGVKADPANFSPGNHTCRVGASGAQVGTALQNDSASWFFNVAPGANATDYNGAPGGKVADSFGLDSGYDGGDGGSGSAAGLGGGGGGGAGGPHGAGKNGGTVTNSGHGAGGGGADNGNAGTGGDANNAGQGGISGLTGSTAGAGATVSTPPGNGSLGAGGGGGYAFGSYINAKEGNSGGTQFDASHGCGGGGGGGGINGDDVPGGWGGEGGAYGGGGGGGGSAGADYGSGGGGSYGPGADGLLIVTYGSAPASPTLKLASIVIDNGLAELHTYGTMLYLCTQEPTTYAQASSTYAKGHATIAFGSPTNDTLGDGRKVVSGAISSGTIDGTGDVTHWAVVDPSGGGRLLATGNFENPVSVEDGQGFTLEALHLALPWG